MWCDDPPQFCSQIVEIADTCEEKERDSKKIKNSLFGSKRLTKVVFWVYLFLEKTQITYLPFQFICMDEFTFSITYDNHFQMANSNQF